MELGWVERGAIGFVIVMMAIFVFTFTKTVIALAFFIFTCAATGFAAEKVLEHLLEED